MRTIIKSILLGTLGFAAISGSALAADIIEPIPYEPIPEVPVEIGSGWYLRGDVSYDFESKYDGKYRTFSPGCGGCVPADKDYDEWKIDEGLNVGGGIGYQFTDYFRGDITAHYWNHDVNGHDTNPSPSLFTSDESSDIKAWELMANAYVDLGTFAGLTPYVGGGLGAAHIKYSDFTSVNYNNGALLSPTDSFVGESDWRFAYALMAGVSYDLTQALKLDVGYRYVNIDDGKMFGKNKNGGVVSGNDDGFDRHTVQIGLRYSLF